MQIIKEIRLSTGLSQEKFCMALNIPIGTLRDWEQGAKKCSKYMAELIEFRVKNDPNLTYSESKKSCIPTIKDIRQATGLSQVKFSATLNIPISTLRDWEQGAKKCSKYMAELIEFRVKNDPNIPYLQTEKSRYSCTSTEKPCDTCISVDDPSNCISKKCTRWQTWWLRKWESTQNIK